MTGPRWWPAPTNRIAHYRQVLYGRDFAVKERVDISEVREGDGCLQCQDGTLAIRRGIELGHTFKLGVKYTDANSMDVTYLDADSGNSGWSWVVTVSAWSG